MLCDEFGDFHSHQVAMLFPVMSESRVRLSLARKRDRVPVGKFLTGDKSNCRLLQVCVSFSWNWQIYPLYSITTSYKTLQFFWVPLVTANTTAYKAISLQSVINQVVSKLHKHRESSQNLYSHLPEVSTFLDSLWLFIIHMGMRIWFFFLNDAFYYGKTSLALLY